MRAGSVWSMISLWPMSMVFIFSMSSAESSKSNTSKFCSILFLCTDLGMTTTPL